jgi:biopolymer transport protein ExbD
MEDLIDSPSNQHNHAQQQQKRQQKSNSSYVIPADEQASYDEAYKLAEAINKGTFLGGRVVPAG